MMKLGIGVHLPGLSSSESTLDVSGIALGSGQNDKEIVWFVLLTT